MKATDHAMELPFSKSKGTIYMRSKTNIVAQDRTIEAEITFQEQLKSVVTVTITVLKIIDDEVQEAVRARTSRGSNRVGFYGSKRS